MMRTVFKVNHILTGFLLTISTPFQLLALLGGVLLNKNNTFTDEMPWLVPVWGGMLALLIVAFVLVVKLGDKHPWPPIILVSALVGAVCALIVALALREALPYHINAMGTAQGLTPWRLLYRHISSVLVGVLIAAEAAVQWVQCRRERKKAELAIADSALSTIGLDGFADDDGTYTKPKKLKRSLKRAAAKAEDKASVE